MNGRYGGYSGLHNGPRKLVDEIGMLSEHITINVLRSVAFCLVERAMGRQEATHSLAMLRGLPYIVGSLCNETIGAECGFTGVICARESGDICSQ